MCGFIRAMHHGCGLSGRKLSGHICRGVPSAPCKRCTRVSFKRDHVPACESSFIGICFFIVIVDHSERGFICFSYAPFASTLTMCTRRLTFTCFKKGPEEVVCSRSGILLIERGLNSLVLAEAFHTFIGRRRFRPIFYHPTSPRDGKGIRGIIGCIGHGFLTKQAFGDLRILGARILR